jgi:quinol-cytochrome oxidoreductase complex cytochrome b subunit
MRSGGSLTSITRPMAYSWFILLLTIAGSAFLLLLLQGTPFGTVIHERIPDRPRRRLFVASVSFFLTFAGVRAVVFAVLHDIPPFHFIVQPSGRHIHHLVFGILILLLVGYGWLADIGTGEDDSSILLSRLMAILYGVGAALTLDEFALWLNLRDVYWSPQGRSSIDAVVLFGALLAASAWGAPLLQSREKTKSQ